MCCSISHPNIDAFKLMICHFNGLDEAVKLSHSKVCISHILGLHQWYLGNLGCSRGIRATEVDFGKMTIYIIPILTTTLTVTLTVQHPAVIGITVVISGASGL